MPSFDPDRRRTMLLVGSGVAWLAGCATSDEQTPAPAAPPNGTEAERTDGIDPGNEESPAGTETGPPATTPVPADVVFAKPGGEVTATLYGEGDCGVVLVPQADRDRQSWDPYARDLADDGYSALAIDEGEEREAAAVTAAIGYLRQEVGVERVVVLGASAGGATAITTSADDPEPPEGIVALSPADGETAADRLTVPTLVVVAEGDADRYVSMAESIVDDAGDATLETVDGDAHGQALLDGPAGAAVRSTIGGFLERVCRPPGTA